VPNQSRIIVGEMDLARPSLPVSRDRFSMIFSEFSFNPFVISCPDRASALIVKGKRDQAKKSSTLSKTEKTKNRQDTIGQKYYMKKRYDLLLL
jgi:hypothetical protein